MTAMRWRDEPEERLSPTIGRRVLHTEDMTIAWITLAKGAVVPTHQHSNEQVATVIEGRLRFRIGPGDGEELIASAGESVPLPSNIPHWVEALEDTTVLDVFTPKRDDWLRGDDAYLRR
jgi:quercetin dioxygenase-like cupin family protein